MFNRVLFALLLFMHYVSLYQMTVLDRSYFAPEFIFICVHQVLIFISTSGLPKCKMSCFSIKASQSVQNLHNKEDGIMDSVIRNVLSRCVQNIRVYNPRNTSEYVRYFCLKGELPQEHSHSFLFTAPSKSYFAFSPSRDANKQQRSWQ